MTSAADTPCDSPAAPSPGTAAGDLTAHPTDGLHRDLAPAVADFVEAHAGDWLEALQEWLRIPSISADPARRDAVASSARWLADRLREAGFPTVEVWPTPGAPAVYAEWPAAEPGAPAVLVYGHHDVQPVDPLELWETSPFDPLVRGDELVARGAADDKGQVAMHLLGLAAHLAATGRTSPAVTLKLLVEGEEESGSPHFEALLRERRDRLDCAAVVVSDTGVHDRDTPSVCTGMRGLAAAEVTLRGPGGDLHSGSFGGAVPNPLHAMAALLAALHDADGRVAVPGFYDGVHGPSEQEREAFATLPFDEAAWLATAQSAATAGEAGYTTLERVWARPTAEVNGMWGGYTGPGGKTIVPAEAHAKVSFRLVDQQDPREVVRRFTDWVHASVPPGVRAEVTAEGDGVRPVLTPPDTPALGSVLRAMGAAFGREVLVTREGGSGPEAALAEVLGAPVVFLGVGLPDDRIHAPNERVVVPMLLQGARAIAHLWSDLAVTLSGGSTVAG